MLDGMLNQLRYEEMQQQAAEHRRVRALLQNQQNSQPFLRPIQGWFGKAIALVGQHHVRQSTLAHESRLRSHRT